MRIQRRRRTWLWLTASLALLVGLVFGRAAALVLAHGDANMSVTPAVIAPGSSITVQGEGVEAGEEFTITLEGMNFQATLGMVKIGDSEDFQQEFAVPATVGAGIYLVKATSKEGETLTAELTIEAAITAQEAAVPPEPSAELMQLDRPKASGEWIAIIAGIVVSAVLGLGLVLMRGGQDSQEQDHVDDYWG